MKVTYETPTSKKTVTCDRYERTHGEGINGPHVLTFFKGAGDKERVIGGASRVTEFSEE